QAPVPHDRVSPTPRSNTRIRSAPSPPATSERAGSMTMYSTFAPCAGTVSRTRASRSSAASSSAVSARATTVCGLPVDTRSPGRATSMPPVVTSTELAGSSDQSPMSIVYQASVDDPGPDVPAATTSSPVWTPRAGLRVVRTVLMPSRVPTRMSRASAGTRPLVTSVWAKTRTPVPHVSDRRTPRGVAAGGGGERGPHGLDAITGADEDVAGIGRDAPAGHECVGEDTDSVSAHLGQAAVVVVVVHEPFGSGRGLFIGSGDPAGGRAH